MLPDIGRQPHFLPQLEEVFILGGGLRFFCFAVEEGGEAAPLTTITISGAKNVPLFPLGYLLV